MPFQIFSTFHKPFNWPKKNYVIPVHGGKQVSKSNLPFAIGDNEGDNISSLNPFFCELTVMYAIWKNKLNRQPYWGLCHYRRYFCLQIHWTRVKKKDIYYLPSTDDAFNKIFSGAFERFVQKQLKENTIILCRPFYINGGLTVKQHYVKEHDLEGWEAMERAIEELFPDYVSSLNAISIQTHFFCYNMMIAHEDVWNGYLEWLFKICFHIYEHYTFPENDAYQARMIGFLAERLHNIYFHHHQNRFEKIYLPIANLS